MKCSIVIPCYNEAENIPLILRRFQEILADRDDIEVVLVNNGSTDNSRDIFDALVPKFPFARVVNVEVNQGYGYGILKGLDSAKGDFLGWTHADMQTDPNDVLKAWSIVKECKGENDLYLKGLRKGRSFMDLFFTVGMSFFETIYLRTPLWDINAQPNMFSRSFYEKWADPPHDFSLDLYAMYMAKKEKEKIIRFSVFFPKRIHGHSKWNTGLVAKWKFIKRTIVFSRNLKNGGIK
jgi:glycosyltransferase involved in cell wall biosynthesis